MLIGIAVTSFFVLMVTYGYLLNLTKKGVTRIELVYTDREEILVYTPNKPINTA